jgi:hypothetical protein
VRAPLARGPSATAAVAEAAGARLPAYVTREQARAVFAAAQSTRDRLLFECLWQPGGRVTEVLRLRPRGRDAVRVPARTRPDRASTARPTGGAGAAVGRGG